MNKYELLGVLGEGSYGTVMKCRVKETSEIVAIKKLKESDDDEGKSLKELKMLRELKHHHVVNLLEAFRRKGKLYLVFEYVPKNLLNVLRSYHHGMKEKQVLSYTYQLVKAVHWCHSNNIVHCDIKPENCLITANGILKICDFGFSVELGASTCIGTSDPIATRWYKSPELLVGASYGAGVDVWSIGCIVGELALCRAIIRGKTELDQIVKVQLLLGPFLPHMVSSFLKNSRFTGTKFPRVRGSVVSLTDLLHDKLSDQSISFISSCLQIDPVKRPLASECFASEVFADCRKYDHSPISTSSKLKLTKSKSIDYSTISCSLSGGINIGSSEPRSRRERKTVPLNLPSAKESYDGVKPLGHNTSRLTSLRISRSSISKDSTHAVLAVPEDFLDLPSQSPVADISCSMPTLNIHNDKSVVQNQYPADSNSSVNDSTNSSDGGLCLNFKNKPHACYSSSSGSCEYIEQKDVKPPILNSVTESRRGSYQILIYMEPKSQPGRPNNDQSGDDSIAGERSLPLLAKTESSESPLHESKSVGSDQARPAGIIQGPTTNFSLSGNQVLTRDNLVNTIEKTVPFERNVPSKNDENEERFLGSELGGTNGIAMKIDTVPKTEISNGRDTGAEAPIGDQESLIVIEENSAVAEVREKELRLNTNSVPLHSENELSDEYLSAMKNPLFKLSGERVSRSLPQSPGDVAPDSSRHWRWRSGRKEKGLSLEFDKLPSYSKSEDHVRKLPQFCNTSPNRHHGLRFSDLFGCGSGRSRGASKNAIPSVTQVFSHLGTRLGRRMSTDN